MLYGALKSKCIRLCLETRSLGKMPIFPLRHYHAYLKTIYELCVWKHFSDPLIVPILAFQSFKMPFSMFCSSLILFIML